MAVPVVNNVPLGQIIWTIGHSRHEFEKFAELLRMSAIQVIVDVRTIPSSRMAPQFNEIALRGALAACGIDYIFMGKELGGRPDGDELYDEKGRVLYNKVAESELFLAGIDRVRTGIVDHRVAIMCSEGKPEGCHRHLLVARILDNLGIQVRHILTDGSTVGYAEIAQDDGQATLFELDGGEPWKSVLSVRQALPPNDSLAH